MRFTDSESHASGKHRETTPTDIQRTESATKRTLSAISGYLDPFKEEGKDHLYNLSSGAPVAKGVEIDVLRAEEVGRKEKEKFMRERIYKLAEETKDFFDKVKKD